ncbi:hypothetical protein [Tautonia plasticadhaerens]|nr:hypothetical protein [Tautonia plasticadhaerens]
MAAETHPSETQAEANRRNALKSTGPKTAEGKERSRRNAMRHGFAAEALVPEQDRGALDAAVARWRKEAGPDNVVEEHLVLRAAVNSVTLRRIERAKEATREETAREAVRRWEEKLRHRARKKAQMLTFDPSNVVMDLESTAFGCEWMIRQWQQLEAPLRIGASWDFKAIRKAQNLLGLPDGQPGPAAEESVRLLWLLAAAAMPGLFAALPRLEAERHLPDGSDPVSAVLALRGFIGDQVDRLIALRDEAWEAVEGPERRAVAMGAAAGDTSKDGQLRHRYEVAADRSANAAVRLFLNLRDRRRREILTIAREARDIGIPRAPVGGGWWREADSAPAPPGFERIGSSPTPPEPPAPAGPPPVPASSAAPARNEAISGGDSGENPESKPNQSNDLRNDPTERPSGAPGRTDRPIRPDRSAPRFSPGAGRAIIPGTEIDPRDPRRAP